MGIRHQGASAGVLLEESMERRVSMIYVVAFVGVVFVRGLAATRVAWYVYAWMEIGCRMDMTH